MVIVMSKFGRFLVTLAPADGSSVNGTRPNDYAYDAYQTTIMHNSLGRSMPGATRLIRLRC